MGVGSRARSATPRWSLAERSVAPSFCTTALKAVRWQAQHPLPLSVLFQGCRGILQVALIGDVVALKHRAGLSNRRLS
jgi:hypothetical protein